MKLDLQLTDVTGDPMAAEKAKHAAHLHDDLTTLGFRQIGLIEARLPGAVEQLKPLIAGADTDQLLAAVEEGEVVAVWQNPAQTIPAFATAERHFDQPVLCLDTIAADGRIVETVMKPERAPDFGGFMGLASRDVSPVFKLFARLAGWATGQPGRWSRPHRPRAGFHLELTGTTDTQTLWEHHQQRVMTLLKGAKTTPAHDNLSLYLTTGHRAHQIFEREQKLLKLMDWALAGPIILLIVGAPLLAFYAVANPDTMLAVPVNRFFTAVKPEHLIGFIFAISVGYFLLRGGVRAWLLPHIPFRSPSARQMQQEVKERHGI